MELNQIIEAFKQLTPQEREDFVGRNYPELAQLIYRDSSHLFLIDYDDDALIEKLLKEHQVEITELLDEFCSRDRFVELINDYYGYDSNCGRIY